MTSKSLILSVLIFVPFLSWSQATTIKLVNPSFEDEPQASHTPKGWYDFGFGSETEPDIQPNDTWGVRHGAIDGKTYLGMVVRDNRTYEGVGQKLPSPLLPNTCYKMSIYLSRSDHYHSHSHKTGKETNYIEMPVKLVVSASHNNFKRGQVLAESQPITLFGYWRKWEFIFKPNSKYKHLLLEANYLTSEDHYIIPIFGTYYTAKHAYNGNILVDNVSDIVPCDCPSNKSILSSQ